MDNSDFLQWLVIIAVTIISISFIFYISLRKNSKTVSYPIENLEEVLTTISSTLTTIENKLRTIEINSEDDETLHHLHKDDYDYIIELAKLEIDKSMLLVDKLSLLVEHKSIRVDELEKLAMIDRQIRSINKVLSKRYKKT